MGSFSGGGAGGDVDLKDLKKKQYSSNSSPIQNGEVVDITLDKVKTQLDDHNTRINAIIDPSNPLNSYRGVFPTLANLQSSVINPGALDWALVSGTKTLYTWDTLGQWSSYGVSQEVQDFINNIVDNLKDGVPVEGDTLSKLYNLILDRYTKSETDALLDAKENVLYDVRATEGIIFNLTHLDYVDKLAFATDTNKVFQGCLADGALYWSCANGGEMTFSATLTPNQVKNISLFSPIKYKSEYALNMLVVATAGGLENRISARMFHVYGQNSGYINKISTRTNDSQETTLCEVSSTTSTVNNQIQMQLSSKSSQNISIQCYIN